MKPLVASLCLLLGCATQPARPDHPQPTEVSRSAYGTFSVRLTNGWNEYFGDVSYLAPNGFRVWAFKRGDVLITVAVYFKPFPASQLISSAHDSFTEAGFKVTDIELCPDVEDGIEFRMVEPNTGINIRMIALNKNDVTIIIQSYSSLSVGDQIVVRDFISDIKVVK